MKLGPVAGRVAQRAPLPGLVDFQRGKAGLVAHLPAAGHPVAKVDIGQSGLLRDGDVVEDDVGAQRQVGTVGVVEAVDHGEAVVEDISQADGGEGAAPFPRPGGAGVFDDARLDRRLFDHRGEFEDVHVGHAAIGVPPVKVAAEEAELILGRPGGGGVAAQRAGPLEDAALRPGGGEVRNPDAGGQAGGTFGAGGAVEHVLAAAEALLGQRVVQLLRMLPLERGEQLPLHPAREIGAGLRGRDVELGGKGKGMAHRDRHGNRMAEA